MPSYYVELKQDSHIKTASREYDVRAGIYRIEQYISRSAGTKGTNLLDSMPAMLAYNAERIWIEDEVKVEYVKNRFDHNNVDMEEFTWVKLSAKEFTQ